MQNEHDFVGGKAEKKTFDNGGEIIKVWIPPEELDRIRKDSGINIEIKTSKKGKLYMENDTWQPRGANEYDQNDNQAQNPEIPVVPEEGEIQVKDIPFN